MDNQNLPQNNQTDPQSTQPQTQSPDQSKRIATATPTSIPSPQIPINPDQKSKDITHNPVLSKIIIGLSIVIVILGLFFLFFRLPMSIQVNPSAKLTFDNQNKGESTNFKFWVRPGKHTIRLEKVGYNPKTTEFTQSWFSLTKLSYTLDPAPKLQLIDNGSDALITSQNNAQLLLYFNPEKHAFFKYSFDTGEKAQITPAIFNNLLKLKWNPSGDGVIVWLKYDSKTLANTILEKTGLANNDIATFYYDFHHYDITSQTATLWGTDIFEIAWATTPDRFYFIGGKSGNGYLGKAQNNGQEKTKLLTNIPFTNCDLAIDSQEINAYILGSNKLYQVDLTDPARSLNQLNNSNNTHLIFVDDNNLFLGTNQANPEYQSQEKLTLFNLTDKRFVGKDFYANFNWVNNLASPNYAILEAKKNLATNQSAWFIQKLSMPVEKTVFNYEYLTNEIPNKIWYNETKNILITDINNKLYQLKITLK